MLHTDPKALQTFSKMWECHWFIVVQVVFKGGVHIWPGLPTLWPEGRQITL